MTMTKLTDYGKQKRMSVFLKFIKKDIEMIEQLRKRKKGEQETNK